MRSTSGITCCHFFCSAVFSMPVWRKPMVALALTIVSPESCTTRFNTPCVLGCCGPMLTVITSLRSSGIRVFFDQLAHHVPQRPVALLHARGFLVGRVDVRVGGGPDAAPVAPGERDGLHALRFRGGERRHDVRRLAARRDADGHVAGSPERLDLPREHL